MTEDIRWKQRFNNYLKALQTLSRAVAFSEQRNLSELEELGVFHGFEFTHELAWNMLKDYLEAQGIVGLIGSKNVTREAFKNALIVDGEAWMDMIKARNLALHSDNTEIAKRMTSDIMQRFYPAFFTLAETFSALCELAHED